MNYFNKNIFKKKKTLVFILFENYLNLNNLIFQ